LGRGSLFIKQIKLSRENDEKNELTRKKEMTLNTYSALVDNILTHNRIIHDKFNLVGKTKLSEENMQIIKEDSDLLKHLDHLFEYINQLAVGTKQGIYDLDTLIGISGRLFVRLFDRYQLYIEFTKESYSKNIYKDVEEFIDLIRRELIKNRESMIW